MRSTLLWTYFNSLTPKEITSFSKFLRSPYFNEGKKIVEFFEQLRKLKDSKKDVSREEIFSKIYKGENFNSGKFNQLCSEMVRFIEMFYTQQGFENDYVYNRIFLLKIFNQKELNKEFEKAIARFDKLEINDFTYPPDYYEFKMKMETIKENNTFFKNKYSQKYFFHKVNELASLMMLSYKMRIGSNVVLSNLIEQDNSENVYDELTNVLLDFLNKHKEIFDKNQTILTDYLLINIVRTQNLRKFHEFLKYLKKNKSSIGDVDFLYIMEYLYAFINNVALRDSTKIKDAYEVILLMSDTGYFELVNQISLPMLQSVVYTSTKAKEFDWAVNFMEKYYDRIENLENKNNLIIYLKGYIFFYRKEYQKALEFLYKSKPVHHFVYMRTKCMMKIIMYETKNVDSVYSIIDSVKHYVRNNKLEEDYIIKKFTNFIKYFQSYLKLEEKGNSKDEFNILKGEIENAQILEYKDWLLEKINLKLKASLRN